MKRFPWIIPTKRQLIGCLSEQEKAYLYRHFKGAADPDFLIYLAWLWANGWICDPSSNFEKVINPLTKEFVSLEVLDLDNTKPAMNILYHAWKMEEILCLLNKKGS